MSVRIEWHHANETRSTLKHVGYRAADGNRVTQPFCLFLGASAFEGTAAALEDMLRHALAQVRGETGA